MVADEDAETVETSNVESDSSGEENFHHEENNSSNSGSDYCPYDGQPKPKLVSQRDLNDLIRDLGLPKDGAEHLASFMKKRNLLKPETRVSVYRNRDESFRKYFTTDKELSLMYCTDIKGLMNELKKDVYTAECWRLFIDSSK